MKRFLALGDSYTIGEGVAESERWPSLLTALLRASGIEVAEPQLIARTAWTSDELLDAIAATRPEGAFDFVTLMIGVNDQYRGRDLDEFSNQFSPLFQRAIDLAGGAAGRVVVISVPDWGFTPFGAHCDRPRISAEIDAYNGWLRGWAAARGAEWVDVTPRSRAMLDDARLVAADGLHPSGETHRRWADAIAPVAQRVLSVRRGVT